MQIIVEGIRLQLTPEQVNLIEEERKVRANYRNSFRKMLLHLGFESNSEKYENMPNIEESFTHKLWPWHAEIIANTCIRTTYYVWLTGKGLKTSAFPGGWTYDEPEQVEKEIMRALADLENWIDIT